MLVTAASDGFDAVTRLSYEATYGAIANMRRFLRDEYAEEIERSMGLLWLGAGGTVDAFPSEVDLAKALSPGRLRAVLTFLLKGAAPVDDEEFWQRVGSWVTEEDLTNLGTIEPSANCQRLMAVKRYDFEFVSVATEYRAEQ